MSSSDNSENEVYHGYNGDQFYGEVLKNRYMYQLNLFTYTIGKYIISFFLKKL